MLLFYEMLQIITSGVWTDWYLRSVYWCFYYIQLIVATEQDELERLQFLFERAKENNVPDVKMVEQEEIKDIEPYCQVIPLLTD